MDITPNDEDMIVRTVLGEAGGEGPAGQAAVAHVILNRYASGDYGNTPTDIVLAPHQFEAWQARPRELSGYSKNSPAYQDAKKVVEGVISGEVPDPTGGATNYLNPALQTGLGRKIPAWAQGAPTATIGRHQFFAPNGPVTRLADAPDLLGSWNAAPASSSDDKSAPVQDGDLLSSWNVPQEETLPAGLPAQSPVKISVTPIHPTDDTLPHFINSQMAATQGDDWESRLLRLGYGAVRGLGDVGDTLAQGIAGAGVKGADLLQSAGVISPQTAQSVQNWRDNINAGISADRAEWERVATGSPMAQTGRVLGDVAGSAPFVEMAGALVPASVPAALAARPVLGAAVAGAGVGGTSAALTSAGYDEPLGSQVLSGAVGGGVLGPLIRAGSAVGAGIRRGMFGSISPETAQLAQTARDTYDIPVGAGQISASPAVRFADSVLQRLPFTGYAGRTADQQTAFNRAVSNTFGEDSGTITNQTIRQAKDRIGDVFDSVAQRTPVIQADQSFAQSLKQTLDDARSVLPQSEVTPLEKQLSDIVSAIDPQTHTFSGDTYQALTRKGAPLDRAMQSKDPNIRYYAGQIRDALDDAMQRSAPPDAVQDLIEARRQWKALKTVEPIATAKKAPTGDVRPALLATQASKSYPQGNGPLSDLAAIGQRFLTEPPSSGTAERMLTHRALLYGLGAAGVGGAYEFDPEHLQRDAALAGLAFGGARGASALLRSNWLASALIRSSLLPRSAQPLSNFLSRGAAPAAISYRNANALSGQ